MFRESAVLDTEKEAGVEYVKRAFRELVPGFDIDKNKQVIERLAATGEHFKDAKSIAETLMLLCEPGEDKEEAALIGLLHDIGKSGPPNTDPETVQTIQETFKYKKFETSRFTPVAEFLMAEKEKNFPEAEKMIEILNRAGIDTQMPMIEFWRQHAEWTWKILSATDSGIDKKIATITASHHLLEGKNPAKLDFSNQTENNEIGKIASLEVTDKFILLTLIDKYQAFLERSHTTHEVAIERIGGMIESAELPDNIKNVYRDKLKLLDQKIKQETALGSEPENEIKEAA